MFTSRTSYFITTLADMILPEGGGKPEIKSFPDGTHEITHYGLAVKLDLCLTLHRENSTHQRRTQVFYLICGNRSVWVAIEKEGERWFSFADVPLDRWENTSNHDSCWRSDGVDSPLTKLYFQWAEEINAELPERIAPKDMNDDTFFGLGKPWETVYITHRRPKGENYRREVLKVQRAQDVLKAMLPSQQALKDYKFNAGHAAAEGQHP